MISSLSRPMLSSTQIGVVGENLLVNAAMKVSNGRLSPFKPIADDDGLDVLFFDKETGRSIAIQLKCRTGTDGGGNTVQFDVRGATFKEERHAYVVAALLNEEMTNFECSWLISMKELINVGNKKSDKYVLTPNRAACSADKYTKFRCANIGELVNRILSVCDAQVVKATC